MGTTPQRTINERLALSLATGAAETLLGSRWASCNNPWIEAVFMHEQKWLQSGDPDSMLSMIRARASGRKLRLFAAACLERVRHLLKPAERLAAERDCQTNGPEWASIRTAALAGAKRAEGYDQELVAQANLLRDIFGNPFRQITLDLSCRTPEIVALADAMDMRGLADALEGAGCRHPEVVAHCREPGPHVRGCWVVDLVLGKE